MHVLSASYNRGWFNRGSVPGSEVREYWATTPLGKKDVGDFVALVHRAASFVGGKELTVCRGRVGLEIIYQVRPQPDAKH